MSNLKLFQAVKLYRYWSYRALLTFKLRYRKSKLGLLWPSLSLIFVVVVLGSLWKELMKIENPIQFYVYLAAGFGVWPLLAGTIERGTSPLIMSNTEVPLSCQIFERALLNFFPFLFVLPLLFIFLIFTESIGQHNVLFLPFMLMLFLWVVGVLSFMIAIILYVPDIAHVSKSLMRIAFLATPIVWQLPRLGEHQSLMWFNPFFIPLEAVRYSLSGILYQPDVLWTFPIYALLTLLAGLFALNISVKKIA